MKTKDFDFLFPRELIAQKPVTPRDSSRLLVLERKTGKIQHSFFRQIGDFLRKSDVLVLNETKVFPAKLFGSKIPSKGKAEILLVWPEAKDLGKIIWQKDWRIIAKPGLKIGQKIIFGRDLKGEIIKDLGFERVIRFNKQGRELEKAVFSLGRPPLPSYISPKFSKEKIKKWYQTVFAKKLGAIAAPTAGFHFTKNLLGKLKRKGVIFKYITLHVGLGTFKPIKSQEVEKHQMEKEWGFIDKKTADFLNQAKKDKKRIIAVGTTATRTLETFCQNGKIVAAGKNVGLFIYPGYKFKLIDALITNFHLPKSTPLLLACAFAGKEKIFNAYKEAIRKKYRFYSFGDAMLII